MEIFSIKVYAVYLQAWNINSAYLSYVGITFSVSDIRKYISGFALFEFLWK